MARKSPVGTRRGEALDAILRGMFRALERRPTPARLRSVVEQLDEGPADEAEPSPRKAGGGWSRSD